ncbi:MAG: hypothetical protein L0H53_08965 [Candidatus Nitrosocosmicus sp.]|nr:hypothetical protein [Candidatus Nitrosocosmicus sp.]
MITNDDEKIHTCISFFFIKAWSMLAKKDHNVKEEDMTPETKEKIKSLICRNS